MATGLDADEGVCQEECCEEEAGMTYYVDEKKERGCNFAAPKWYCTEHEGEEVQFYCEVHDKAICLTCVAAGHQQLCILIGVKEAFHQLKGKLLKAKEKLRENHRKWGQYNTVVGQCRDTTNEHLISLKHKANSFLENEEKNKNEKEENEKRRINEESDERRIDINEKGEEMLRRAHEDAEERRRPIHYKRCRLLGELDDIASTTNAKINEMTLTAQKIMQAIDHASNRIETLLLDERELVLGAKKLLTSLTLTLQKSPDEDAVQRIAQTVTGVRFEKGTGDNMYSSGFVGYETKWELVDSIKIPSRVRNPIIVGCTDEEQIIISENTFDVPINTYSLNVSHKEALNVVTFNDLGKIMSCIILDEETMACGKWKRYESDLLEGCISLYDRQWRFKRDITIPGDASGFTAVFVDVGNDGMIRAAQCGQSKVYVIDPTDRRITNTITCKQNIVLHGVLSTGKIVAQTWNRPYNLITIGRNGEQTGVTSSKITRATVCVDLVTDCLYHLQCDKDSKMCVVDQLASTGDVERKAVIKFPLAPGCTFDWLSRLGITPLGKLVVSNGKDCLIFKRQIIFGC